MDRDQEVAPVGLASDKEEIAVGLIKRSRREQYRTRVERNEPNK
jgi:hypothetical protein